MTWPCIAEARRHDAGARVPFEIATKRGACRVGSVARVHVEALSSWRRDLAISTHAVRLLVPSEDRTAWFAAVNPVLHAQGLVRGWRGEPYGVVTALGRPALAIIERAAARFWGTLTFGSHCNGFVADAKGRPTHLWIAQRSDKKATDPGMLDNLVGGGVPWPQSPHETLIREAWEEAGLEASSMTHATAQSVYRLYRDLPEGLQDEELHAFDLQLDPMLMPCNQDGEVAAFFRCPVDQALAQAAAGEMTVDASLVTLDFAVRHGLMAPDEHAAHVEALRPLQA